jgi:phospholipase/carboxylesterase
MNRIHQLVDEESERHTRGPLVAELDVEERSDEQDAHCLVTPLHYERNYAYPLIVWLHGAEGDERQVTRVMPLVSNRNYAGVGPRGTVAEEGSDRGYRWSQSPAHIARAERRVLSAVAAARRWLNIEPSRIYLAGYGGGGTMAFRVALAQPQLFAGVCSFGGRFPTTLRPLGRLDEARKLNMFIATGREGAEYGEAEVCRDLRLFHAAGMSLCLRLYPCRDELLSNMLSDMDRWIMEQMSACATGEPRQAAQRSPRQ